MSLPSKSVPNRCVSDGDALAWRKLDMYGLYGVILPTVSTSTNVATTKITTVTTPNVERAFDMRSFLSLPISVLNLPPPA